MGSHILQDGKKKMILLNSYDAMERAKGYEND